MIGASTSRVLVDGVEYPSIAAAAEAFGISHGAAQSRLLSDAFPGWTRIDPVRLMRRRRWVRDRGKERPCMSCRRPFRSEGPHNRLCRSCADAAADASPYAP